MSIFANTKKIEDIKPTNGTTIINYMKRIEEKKAYYVPYSTEYADEVTINCYFTNGIYQLTMEYDVPSKNSKQGIERIKLVIAENKDRIADFPEVQRQMKTFLKQSKIYAKVPVVERHIANIEQRGWKFTQEGLDFMLVSKPQGEVEIQKTKYLGEELDTGVDLELKKLEHITRIDEKAINTMKQYITSTYKKLPTDLSTELQNYRSKVITYSINKQFKKGNQNDLLSIIFRETKPMLEETQLIPLMQKSFNQNIEAYMDMIPEEYRDEKIHSYIKEYLAIRLTSINEKEENDGKLDFNSNSIKRLEKLDEQYTNFPSQRDSLRKRADFCLGIKPNEETNEKQR